MNGKLEKEVMKELVEQLGTNENPFRAYLVEFPFRVEMTLVQNDTNITIDT